MTENERDEARKSSDRPSHVEGDYRGPKFRFRSEVEYESSDYGGSFRLRLANWSAEKFEALVIWLRLASRFLRLCFIGLSSFVGVTAFIYHGTIYVHPQAFEEQVVAPEEGSNPDDGDGLPLLDGMELYSPTLRPKLRPF